MGSNGRQGSEGGGDGGGGGRWGIEQIDRLLPLCGSRHQRE